MSMDFPAALLAAVGALLIFLVLLRPRAAVRRMEAPGGGASAREAEAVRDELDGVVARLQEVSREQLARLDTKIQILNQLVVEADRKIAELKAAAQAARDARPAGPPPEPPATAGPSARAPAPAAPPPANPLHDRIFALADGGAGPPEIAAATGLPRGEVELILGLRDKAPAGA